MPFALRVVFDWYINTYRDAIYYFSDDYGGSLGPLLAGLEYPVLLRVVNACSASTDLSAQHTVYKLYFQIELHVY